VCLRGAADHLIGPVMAMFLERSSGRGNRSLCQQPHDCGELVEFQGKGIVEAALEACRLRLRPIVMTSVAFIAGTIPLVLSSGAGAEVRSATGVTVFAGMLGVTLFGLLLTPVFYVGLRKLSRRKLIQHGAASLAHGATTPAHI
jgi:hypothetical protein